jgi:tellurite resistance protein TerC
MTLLIWVGFLVFVLVGVMLDLGVFQRKIHTLGLRQALTRIVIWVLLALAFNVFVFFLYEHDWFGATDIQRHQQSGWAAATQFLAGYLVEESLSADNLFVIAMILTYFAVPVFDQQRVLFWGILGAVVLRGIMIGVGVALIQQFNWIIYVFGGLLIVSAAKMLFMREDELDPEDSSLVKLARRVFPVTGQLQGNRFFVRMDRRLHATPMFLALVLVESSDVMFAIDSIPAVFAITQDPFLVFTSNIFAILGLRSMYFALAGFIEKFRYLKISLVFILGYVGVKMLVSHYFPISHLVSLSVIIGILTIGIVASVVAARREARHAATAGAVSGSGTDGTPAD